MKRGTVAALTASALAVLTFSLVSCGANSQENAEEKTSEVTVTAPVDITATNVQWVTVDGLGDKIAVFDIVRDGRLLTCTTKNSFRAGVSCIPKEDSEESTAPIAEESPAK